MYIPLFSPSLSLSAQNIDKERLAEVDDDDSSLTDSYQSLRESLGHVTCLLGRLTLAWRVLEKEMERRLEQQPSSPEANCWLVGDALNTFVTSKVSSVAPSLVPRHCLPGEGRGWLRGSSMNSFPHTAMHGRAGSTVLPRPQ